MANHEQIESTVAWTMLAMMDVVESATLAGDPFAQKFLDAGAVRLVDGQVQFHQEKFNAIVAEDITMTAKELGLIP